MESWARAGSTIDERFRLEDCLGSGTSASVWRARDLATGERVALKLLHPRFRLDGGALEAFQREANALTRLRHPGIARAVAFGVERSEPYLALEYVEGSTLEEELEERAESEDFLPLGVVMVIFEELTAALAHAHEKGVVHRDLKPSNLMFVQRGGLARSKILDFGVAKLLDEGPDRQTTEGRVRGSVAYMSPEQIQGGSVDGRADVFALGVILFECLTLHRAWIWERESGPCMGSGAKVGSGECNSWIEVVERIASAPCPRVGDYRQGVETFEPVVQRAMAKERDERFSGPGGFWEAMREAAAGLGAERKATARGDLVVEQLRTRAVSRLGSAQSLDRAETPARPPDPSEEPALPLPRLDREVQDDPAAASSPGLPPSWGQRLLWTGIGLALGYLLGRLLPGP